MEYVSFHVTLRNPLVERAELSFTALPTELFWADSCSYSYAVVSLSIKDPRSLWSDKTFVASCTTQKVLTPEDKASTSQLMLFENSNLTNMQRG